MNKDLTRQAGPSEGRRAPLHRRWWMARDAAALRGFVGERVGMSPDGGQLRLPLTFGGLELEATYLHQVRSHRPRAQESRDPLVGNAWHLQSVTGQFLWSLDETPLDTVPGQ
ncbi:hypothetical protein GQ55_5G190500 [Panicum hallii var. hallii]|uniref:Uncharacterized protein n=1 Tax=Panicum hallii var. hallii TaxID=1504633 RepID=A0A2T7DHY5_9POAL|nr:hypothetical protein GQ55_5G190500 [Panicum hallii var. hallii]